MRGFNFKKYRQLLAEFQEEKIALPFLTQNQEEINKKISQILENPEKYVQLSGEITKYIGDMAIESADVFGVVLSGFQNSPYKPGSDLVIKKINEYSKAIQENEALAKKLFDEFNIQYQEKVKPQDIGREGKPLGMPTSAYNSFVNQLKQELIKKVLSLHSEELASYATEPTINFFSEKEGKNLLAAFFNQANIEMQKKAVLSKRTLTIEQLRNDIKQKINDLRSKKTQCPNLTDDIIMALFLLPTKDNRIELLKDKNILECFNETDLSSIPFINNLVRDNNDGTRAGQIWSHLGKDENELEINKSIMPDPMPINAYSDILLPLGIRWDKVEDSSIKKCENVFFYKMPKPTNKEEYNLAIEERRKDDEVILPVFKQYIDEFLSSNSSNAIERLHLVLTDRNTVPRNEVEQCLKYCYEQICEKTLSKFRDMLLDIGYDKDDPIYALGGRIHKDEVYTCFNIDSGPERAIINKLRSYGLAAVPQRISITAPDFDKSGSMNYIVDFVIPCDVISHWEQDESGLYHPVIKEKVVFVGEYYGMLSNTKRYNLDKNLYLPDGSIAKSSKYGNELTAGSNATIGDKYSVKTEWKKMTENFASNIIDSSAIYFEEKDIKDDSVIMNKLDEASIIYRNPAIDVNNINYCIASHNLIEHKKVCHNPNCDVHKFLVVDSNGRYTNRTVSPEEALIRSFIAKYDAILYNRLAMVGVGEMPLINTQLMFNYYNEYNEYLFECTNLWNTYSKDKSKENYIAYLNKLNEFNLFKKESIQDIREKYEELKMLENQKYVEFGKLLNDIEYYMQIENSDRYAYILRACENIIKKGAYEREELMIQDNTRFQNINI